MKLHMTNRKEAPSSQEAYLDRIDKVEQSCCELYEIILFVLLPLVRLLLVYSVQGAALPLKT